MSSPVPVGGKCRFTIVDDEAPTRFLIEHVLRAEFPQCSITDFSDAEEAFHYLQQPKTDILITDHSMSGMTGGELIARLRAAGSDLPIIMVSSSPHAREEAEKNGANIFMDKGEIMEHLTDRVRALLHCHQALP